MEIKTFDDYMKMLQSNGELFVSETKKNRFLKCIDGASITLSIDNGKLIVKPSKTANMDPQEVPLKALKNGNTVVIEFPQHIIVNI